MTDMYPQAREFLDDQYKDNYTEMQRFIHGIDKYVLEGPMSIKSEELKIYKDAAAEREIKYQQYIRDKEAGKEALYFRDDPRDPRDVDFSKLPPITIDEKGFVSDGTHRAFLAKKVGADLLAYKIVFKKNNHPNVERILELVRTNETPT